MRVRARALIARNAHGKKSRRLLFRWCFRHRVCTSAYYALQTHLRRVVIIGYFTRRHHLDPRSCVTRFAMRFPSFSVAGRLPLVLFGERPWPSSLKRNKRKKSAETYRGWQERVEQRDARLRIRPPVRLICKQLTIVLSACTVYSWHISLSLSRPLIFRLTFHLRPLRVTVSGEFKDARRIRVLISARNASASHCPRMQHGCSMGPSSISASGFPAIFSEWMPLERARAG